ncbi:hypothetical protein PAHAL_4G328000 [Panicum hallii]|uniref:Uncharacterized protein n=1 Tax=Panicum hallii TaxID=206008 RepID=A0A2T8JES9_9POAL|nr:hypothetical protein PAHAL_4G328000 [Panicum hallii]
MQMPCVVLIDYSNRLCRSCDMALCVFSFRPPRIGRIFSVVIAQRLVPLPYRPDCNRAHMTVAQYFCSYCRGICYPMDKASSNAWRCRYLIQFFSDVEQRRRERILTSHGPVSNRFLTTRG